MKKLVCLLIMTTMVLHCASRLGALGYLYEKRHSIAYHLGLIAEIPIAICNSDYHHSQELVMQQDEKDQEPQLTTASEIQLFLHYPDVHAHRVFRICAVQISEDPDQRTLTGNRQPVFHPPACV